MQQWAAAPAGMHTGSLAVRRKLGWLGGVRVQVTARSSMWSRLVQQMLTFRCGLAVYAWPRRYRVCLIDADGFPHLHTFLAHLERVRTGEVLAVDQACQVAHPQLAWAVVRQPSGSRSSPAAGATPGRDVRRLANPRCAACCMVNS